MKLVDAVDYRTDYLYRSYVPGDHEPVNLEFFYPVMVIAGRLIDVHHDGREIELTDAEHLMYRRLSVWNGDRIATVIDVVTENFFPRYLDMVECELREVAVANAANADLVNRSANQLAAEHKVMDDKSPISTRRHFTF